MIFFDDDLLDFSHVDEEQQNEEEEKDYVLVSKIAMKFLTQKNSILAITFFVV